MSHWKHRKPIITTKTLSILVNANVETVTYLYIKLWSFFSLFKYLNDPFIYLYPREQLMSAKPKSIPLLFCLIPWLNAMASKRLANAFLSNQPRKKMFCNLVSFYHLSNFLVWHCRIVFMLTMTWISLRWILISFLNLSLSTSFQFYEHHPYFLVQMTLLPIHNIILLFAAHPFIHFRFSSKDL